MFCLYSVCVCVRVLLLLMYLFYIHICADVVLGFIAMAIGTACAALFVDVNASDSITICCRAPQRH